MYSFYLNCIKEISKTIEFTKIILLSEWKI